MSFPLDANHGDEYRRHGRSHKYDNITKSWDLVDDVGGRPVTPSDFDGFFDSNPRTDFMIDTLINTNREVF